VIVTEPKEAIWAWANNRLKIPWSSDFVGFGVTQDSCLKAVVVYNGFTRRVCYTHVAIDDPKVITRTFVRAVLEYPFVQCDLKYVIGLVDETNESALTLYRHLGAKELHRFPGAGVKDCDFLLLSLDRDDCKWIKGGNYGLRR